VNVTIRDGRGADTERDPVFERIYGKPRSALWSEFRAQRKFPRASVVPLSVLREFSYWLFQERVKACEPARLASDTRKALALLSSMEAAVRRRKARAAEREPEEAVAVAE
jgi:hypothetical protein